MAEGTLKNMKKRNRNSKYKTQNKLNNSIERWKYARDGGGRGR
jgi:hypothetical protein